MSGTCNVSWHTPLLLLTLLPVVVGAHAQSSTDGHQVAPDIRQRRYWADPSTGLMWSARDNGRDVDWREARGYCWDLQAPGYDWRLPTIEELEGIYDRSANSVGLGGKRNEQPQTFHVKGDLFLTGLQWSASHSIGADGRPTGWAYRFDFINGGRFKDELAFRTGKRALCVRDDVQSVKG
jgi:Protein of unknown function (DUF1566)